MLLRDANIFRRLHAAFSSPSATHLRAIDASQTPLLGSKKKHFKFHTARSSFLYFYIRLSSIKMRSAGLLMTCVGGISECKHKQLGLP